MAVIRLLPVIVSFGILVVLLTALSGLVFRGGSLRKRYQLKK